MFDADGGFLNRVGRLGSGPGEFRDIGSIVVTEDGVFSVLDRGRGAIMTFDWTGELPREVRTANWLPIARGPGRSVWMAPVRGSYQIELWGSKTLVRVLRRDVEWFPPDQMGGHGWEEKPDPIVPTNAGRRQAQPATGTGSWTPGSR